MPRGRSTVSSNKLTEENLDEICSELDDEDEKKQMEELKAE